ncbi:MAG: VTT domain-containing protein [Candidatus Paceibacterota bacterium]|jgi:membrane-associated protein
MEQLIGIDLIELLKTIGYVGIFLIIFAESGLFFGFFFPGDSLLFSAGILAATGIFDITLLIPLLVVAAISGDSVGYWFGTKIGPSLFTRPDSLFFHREYVIRTENFYNKYGKKTIVLARFVPIVRTFAPIIAGIAKMDYLTFIRYNIFGGLIWAIFIPLSGYLLGNSIPNVDHYLLLIVILITLTSFLPIISEYYRKN